MWYSYGACGGMGGVEGERENMLRMGLRMTRGRGRGWGTRKDKGRNLKMSLVWDGASR